MQHSVHAYQECNLWETLIARIRTAIASCFLPLSTLLAVAVGLIVHWVIAVLTERDLEAMIVSLSNCAPQA